MFIGNSCIDRNNTILDDNPEKYVCNEATNCLFLQTWIREALSDDFLLIFLLGYSNCTPIAILDSSGIML
jgi:hypothetical protein